MSTHHMPLVRRLGWAFPNADRYSLAVEPRTYFRPATGSHVVCSCRNFADAVEDAFAGCNGDCAIGKDVAAIEWLDDTASFLDDQHGGKAIPRVHVLLSIAD